MLEQNVVVKDVEVDQTVGQKKIKRKKKPFMNARKLKMNLSGYGFMLPAMAILLLFNILPIIFSVILSFFSWDMMTGDPVFIGFDNFNSLLVQGELYHSLKLTLLYTILSVIPAMIFGIFFAVLLDQKLRGIGFYRSIFFAPLMTSTVAISVIWMWIFHADYGVLNEIITFFGFESVPWLNNPDTAIYALIIMNIWKTLGFSTVLYLAALQNIPSDVIEAARMDGASNWMILKNIKVPLISPTTFLLMIFLTIEQFQTFAQVNVMTGGGPAKSTTLLVPFLWEYAFERFEMGYASAVAVLLFLIVLILTLLQMFITRKKVHYQ